MAENAVEHSAPPLPPPSPQLAEQNAVPAAPVGQPAPAAPGQVVQAQAEHQQPGNKNQNMQTNECRNYSCFVSSRD